LPKCKPTAGERNPFENKKLGFNTHREHLIIGNGEANAGYDPDGLVGGNFHSLAYPQTILILIRIATLLTRSGD
jgi:hypothetical protein